MLLTWLAALAMCGTAWAVDPPVSAEPAPEALDFFEKEVRPLLASRCYECHGPGDKIKGGLRLTSRAAILAGGETGPAAEPGKPAASLLIEAVKYQGLEMPPKAKLPAEDINRLARWVELGLPWPAGDTADAPVRSADIDFTISDAQRNHWSFQSLRQVPPPAVQNAAWPAGNIDRFILAGLESRGLAPNGPASKPALLRRASFDLIGLPPTPAETEAFLADQSPQAFEKVIDRLLTSPHYGERWGRHWLDVVRYADTAGETADYPVPQGYKYRNYVIDSFNRDKPYDEFVREQIAGDLLAAEGPAEKYAERVTATGFVAISRRFGFDPENYQHLTIADTIDTVGRSVLGLSIGCARCHDHKYDPLSMRDYYALYGIFASTRYAFPGSEEKKTPRDFVPLLPPAQAKPLADAQQAELARLDAEMKRLDEEQKTINARVTELAAASKPAEGATAEPVPAERQAQLDAAKAQLAQCQQAQAAQKAARDALAARGPYEIAYAVVEGTPANARIQKRGEPTRLGDEAPRRFLEILGGDALPAENSGSGRRQLADWLTAPGNPLTPRVIANRLWHYHFGQGLVATTSDFGLRGRRPTHPELLDYLAGRLMAEGWSLKSLHKEIMLSRAYQMSSAPSDRGSEIDPGNESIWRFDSGRLDAESIRDAILAISGGLDTTVGGPHPFPPANTWGFTQHAPFKAVYDSRQRSVYLMTQRIQRHPFLALFDGADPNVSTSERSSTTTPTQALFMMNDPFVHEQSMLIAKRLLGERGDDAGRLQLLYELAYARAPREPESQAGVEFLARYASGLQTAGVPGDQQTALAWAALARVIVTSNEFLYLD